MREAGVTWLTSEEATAGIMLRRADRGRNDKKGGRSSKTPSPASHGVLLHELAALLACTTGSVLAQGKGHLRVAYVAMHSMGAGRCFHRWGGAPHSSCCHVVTVTLQRFLKVAPGGKGLARISCVLSPTHPHWSPCPFAHEAGVVLYDRHLRAHQGDGHDGMGSCRLRGVRCPPRQPRSPLLGMMAWGRVV